MKLKIRSSLAFKLLFALAFSSLMMVAALAYVNTKIIDQGYKRQLGQMLENNIVPVRFLLGEAVSAGNREQVDKTLRALVNDPTVDSVTLVDEKAQVILSLGESAKTHLFTIDKPVYNKAGEPVARILINVSNAAYSVMMQRYYEILSAIVVGYLLLLLLLLRMVYRSFLPLRELTEKLNAFDPRNPEPIALGQMNDDEVGLIAAAANKMCDNITSHAGYMRELNAQIREGQQHLKEAQQIARMGSWWLDPRSRACEFSDQIYALLGVDRTEKILKWSDFVQSIETKDRRAFERAVESTVQTHTPFRLMHKLVNLHGETLHVLTEGKVSINTQGQKVVTGISMDVTEQTESQRMVEKLAFYDPLTNLPNRILFNDRLSKAIKDAHRRGEKVGVFFLDLDRFKNVNDTLGHTLGDMLLKEVAERLKRTLRDSDTISRIGGDEFIVVVPMIEEEDDVKAIAKKVLTAMQERWELGDKSVFTTSSIGVALYPDHADDVDTLVKFADAAMYKAKEGGRNSFKIYSSSMGEKIEQKLKIEHELREAIATMEQFELYYQPKISLRSGAIAGAEVLIRWNHPKLGLVYPDAFIPVAENTGMIIQIGKWVMHESARQIERWKKEGIAPLRLAVNLSGRQFQSPTLLYYIRSVLNEYDIKPQYLEFEVTESVSMISLHESLKVLHQLKELGVGVVIDDFGTGYSSLAYLKQFPVDTLKIDKAFIMNMLEEQDDRTIVESIVSLSKAMNLKVVAEGVETIEHVRLLKKIGVDFGQGYFFSKPVPIAQFDRMYRRNLDKMRERREAQQKKAEEA